MAVKGVRMVAARTFSPAERTADQRSACGYFAHYSMPGFDSAAMAAFWEPLGFVAMPEESEPYPHQTFTSDGINLAMHSPRLLPAPALVFCEEDMATKIASLRDSGVPFASLPRGVAAGGKRAPRSARGNAAAATDGDALGRGPGAAWTCAWRAAAAVRALPAGVSPSPRNCAMMAGFSSVEMSCVISSPRRAPVAAGA